jgi:hypothetical protein
MAGHLARLLTAAVLALAPLAALAQAPPPIPALPDETRAATYTPTASTGPFAVPFALYADGTDFAQAVEVWLDGLKLVAGTDWTLTTTSGSLATLARPITNAQVTLTTARTGTLRIFGARRPRRVSQFQEGAPVTARALNQALTDLVAQSRESWDFLRARTLAAPGGDAFPVLPPATTRASTILGFDGAGLPKLYSPGSGVGSVIGPAGNVDRRFAIFDGTGNNLQAGAPSYDVKLYGARDGFESTAAIQAAINQAQITGGCVYLSVGTYLVSSTLTITDPAAGSASGGRVCMYGDAMGLSVLQSSVATDPTLSITANGNAGQQRVVFRDFTIVKPGAPRTGTGILVTSTQGMGYLTFNHVAISGFGIGLDSVNGLSIWVQNAIIDHNSIGIRAVQSGIGSFPNAWRIADTVMSANTSFAINFANAAMLYVDNLDCESNGTMGQVAGCIHINGNPVNGSMGLFMTGGYIQGNLGTADVLINAGGGTEGTHSIYGVEFARVDPTNYVTNHIQVIKSTSPQVNVNVHGSSFKSFNGYTPSTARREIAVGSVSDGNYTINLCNNSYFDAVSAPVVDGTFIKACGASTPAALTKSNDTNVTLTLGGDPSTALLAATSIAAGWTGTLSSARGGFGADVSAQSGVPLFTTGTPTFTSTTGSGNFARATSPTFVTPILGTPTSATLTNATGLPVSTGISGLATGIATFLATPSSANLASAVTDETGSGALVFGTSPTLATPVINGLPTGTGVATANTVSTVVARDGSGNFSAGTITAALSGNAATATSATTATNATNTAITDDTTTNATMNLTWVTSNSGNLPQKTTSTKLTFNPSTGALSATSFTGSLAAATGLPISTGVSGLGTGVATFLATPSGANLLSALTTKTGTGIPVFDTSPTFTTQITVPQITAGSGVSQAMTFIATSGIGSGSELFTFKGGTNGSQQFASISSGLFSIDGPGDTQLKLYTAGASKFEWYNASGGAMFFYDRVNSKFIAYYTANGGICFGNCTTDPGLGNLLAAGWVGSGASVVASLPTCNAAAKGGRYFATDSNTTTFLATVAGGGANNVPVTCDGTNWKVS